MNSEAIRRKRNESGLRVDLATALERREDAYARLIEGALQGDPARFARQDAVEKAWRIVEPAITSNGSTILCERDTWGAAGS